MKVQVSFPHTKNCFKDAVTIVETYHNDKRQDIVDRAKKKIQDETYLGFNEYDGYRSNPTKIEKL